MADLNQIPAVTVDGETVSLADALRRAKWRRQVGFLREAADDAIVLTAIRQSGIQVSDEELQGAADEFRRQKGLFGKTALKRWLRDNRLTEDEWISLLEEDAARLKLRERLTGDRVSRYFAENRLDFDAATISRIVVEDEGVAREIRAAIVDDAADFYAMARQFSTDASTRPASGYAGSVRREGLESALASAIFGARSGEVVGPVKSDRGWQIVKIESRQPAVLNDEARASIQALLFDQWLEDQRAKSNARYVLIDPA